MTSVDTRTSVTVRSEPHTPEELAAQIQAAQAQPCVDQFHMLWYHAPHTWAMTRYKGVPMLKCPMDLQVYHELIWDLRPDLVIETGTLFGGSALWFADQMEPWGGRVVSIDIENQREPVAGGYQFTPVKHPYITFLEGDSTAPATVARAAASAAPTDRVMVVLDSDHHEAHVRKELDAYAGLVSVGSYLVVEDTNISGRPLVVPDDGGPGAAVESFVAEHPEFGANALCERFLLTMHPRGWLWRKS